MKSQMPALAILSLTLLSGCSKQNEFKAPPPPEVTARNPEQKNVTVYTAFPGRLVASDEVEIRARVKGYLKSIDFTDGQHVKKGDLLFTIEPEEYASAVKSAEARLTQAQATLKLATTRYQKNANAFKTKAVSELDLLSAEADKESAAAAVLEAQAALENARRNLSYTEIHAPMDGRIGRRALSVGNIVGDNGSTLLTVLVAESPIDVFFNVDERALLPFLKSGVRSTTPGEKVPPVKLELADGTLHSEEGRINYVDPKIDPATGTLRARAVFSNAALKLAPGLYGKILIPKPIENAVLVPDLAIQRDMSGPYVLIVNTEGNVESRHIETGSLVENRRIVQKGLSTMDRVIVEGIQRARPGIPVRVAQPSAQ